MFLSVSVAVQKLAKQMSCNKKVKWENKNRKKSKKKNWEKWDPKNEVIQ